MTGRGPSTGDSGATAVFLDQMRNKAKTRGPALWPSWSCGGLGHSGPVLPPQVLGLLVWALIADTPYHLYPAYGWVMFVAVFLWLVTIVFFFLYLFQLHLKWYMVPWPLVVSQGGGPGGSGLTPLPLGVATTGQ